MIGKHIVDWRAPVLVALVFLFFFSFAIFSSASALSDDLHKENTDHCGTIQTPSPPRKVVEQAVEQTVEKNSRKPDLTGMVLISGGQFVMGGVGPAARRDEFPRHQVDVDSFFIDATEVTNSQFKRFVDETGYLTTAQQPVDWEEMKKDLPVGTPKPDEEKLLAGSMVFTPPDKAVALSDYSKWWSWTAGADWLHPRGPGSSIDGLDDHPVVQVSFVDALAYCKWAGKRLPTEAEWEYAARGGISGKIYCWGDEKISASHANTWQGEFPSNNTLEDGFSSTSPVRTFPPNGYGLYDMAGNVWEWCQDLYRPTTYLQRVIKEDKHAVSKNPKGPESSADGRNPHARELHVLRGGSFLCHASYCTSYRPSARMSCSPDTGMPHTGFRCVMDADLGVE